MNRFSTTQTRPPATICGILPRWVIFIGPSQQPQYTGLLQAVNTKCCMRKPSSPWAITLEVFLEIPQGRLAGWPSAPVPTSVSADRNLSPEVDFERRCGPTL
jgi:hypothetical protein